MVNPESFLTSPSLYKDPTNVEMFGLKNPFPTIINANAKKKAMSNAKADLAGTIQTTIKATIDNYVNSREFNNKEQVEERFEGLSREVINQKLSGVVTICEKTFKTAQGKYKTYVCLELRADDLVDAINERLTKDESLRIDYDYEKFKDTLTRKWKN